LQVEDDDQSPVNKNGTKLSTILKMMISEQNDEVSDASASLSTGYTGDDSSNAAGKQKIIINP